MPSPFPLTPSPLLSRLIDLSTTWSTLPVKARLSQLAILVETFPPPPLPTAIPPLLVTTLSTLLPPPSEDQSTPESVLSQIFHLLTLSTVSQPSPAPSRKFQLSIAHIIHTLTTTAKTHDSHSLRTQALTCLVSVLNFIPPSLLAAFLPGLVSALAHLLSSGSHLRSPLLIAALRALHTTFLAFPTVHTLPPSKRSSQTTLSDALLRLRQTPDSVSTPSPSCTSASALKITQSKQPSAKPQSFLVHRDEKWAAHAGKEVSTRLLVIFERPDSPSAHLSAKARQTVAWFCAAVVKDERTLRLTERAAVLMRLMMAELGGDTFDEVRSEAVSMPTPSWVGRSLKALVASVETGGEANSGMVEEVLGKLIRVRGDELWVKIGEGLLRMGRGKMKGVVLRVGVERFASLLMKMTDTTWEIGAEGDGQVVEELSNRILAVSFELGDEGLLSSIYSTLIRLGSVDEDDDKSEHEIGKFSQKRLLITFKKRAWAVLVLISVLRGEMGRQDIHEGSARQHLSYVGQCVKEVLEAMTWFLVPAVHVEESEGAALVDDTMVSLKRALLSSTANLIDGLSYMHRRVLRKPLPSDVVLVVLLGLLRDIAHGEQAVRKGALCALRRVALVMRCSSERRLIGRHLNFIISRLAFHLEESWAGHVLRFVIGEEGDDVSHEATILLEGTIRGICNNLAGATDTNAIRSLKSIRSILSSAVDVSYPLHQRISSLSMESDRDFNKSVSKEEAANLYKRLFYYCTDDTENYDELTLETPIITANEGEDQRDSVETLNPFELVGRSTLDGMRDLLVGRPWNVRSAALSCAGLAVQLLRNNQKELLPHAANFLPLIPDQFVVLTTERSARDRLLDSIKRRKLRGREDAEEVEDLVQHLNRKAAELPVVTNACLLLAALAMHAGSFIRHRFVTLIYPKMRPLLRLASCFPTLVGSTLVSPSGRIMAPPSHGAMAASDACLEAIAAMAEVVPEALAPHSLSLVRYLAVFFDPQFHPMAKRQRNLGHLNRSMLRYENERWDKRASWADCVVRNLKSVSAGDVLVGLLSLDESAPREIRPRISSLHNIRIRGPSAGNG
eukprot:GFKZ01010417.1.p1 GENE.GFKZ01010417.1~~GFKZ01010417.1.p1  ORF type:complete len:1083 (+),score=131.24 GFKZ01010417.1:32-3250(+)